uniref:Uncharacterized protein n=1 Tax=Cacopsylla melanoneura TaxID=428564 RepID=A0A8D8XBM8_9HEMI
MDCIGHLLVTFSETTGLHMDQFVTVSGTHQGPMDCIGHLFYFLRDYWTTLASVSYCVRDTSGTNGLHRDLLVTVSRTTGLHWHLLVTVSGTNGLGLDISYFRQITNRPSSLGEP